MPRPALDAASRPHHHRPDLVTRLTSTVLHLIPSLDVGGAESLLLDLVRALRGSAYPQIVVSMQNAGGLIQTFRDEGVEVRRLGMTRGRPDPRAPLRLRAIVRAERPGIVQCWMYHANLLGLLSLSGLRPAPRLVWCLHAAALDFACYSALTRVSVGLGARLSHCPAAVVANSEATRDYHATLGYRPRQWTIIHNGIDLRRFAPDPLARADVRAELGLPADTSLVGLFARWDPMKDHGTFVRAAAQVATRDPSAHFLLAGQGITPANAELRQLLDAAGPALARRVHLLGLRRDMPRLNAALTVAAITSVSGESFCLAAGEAMASGVPCVVTDLTFLPALVGDTGVVVPRGDADRVAAAVCRLLGMDPIERRALGVRARQRILTHFGLDGMAAQYGRLYDLLLRSPEPSEPGIDGALTAGMRIG
jgi:glycosyltransferase involved in cell wall biosynthesis